MQFWDDGSQWWGFLAHITYDNRFVAWDFALPEIERACKARTKVVPSETRLYRARILAPPGPSGTPKPFSKAEMGAPESPSGGRLNPAGIPYMYMATDQLTAIAELRPWKKALVSVAPVRVIRDLRVYDFVTDAEPSGDAWMIHRLNEAFSTPAHQDDPAAYAPTQFLAERLKSVGSRIGVSGLLYKSSLRESGNNLAIFGGRTVDFKELVEVEEPTLWKTTEVVVEAKPYP